jgi:hypothetical protein
MGMIHETHEAWCSLTNDETPPGDTSMYSVANHVQSRDKALVFGLRMPSLSGPTV